VSYAVIVSPSQASAINGRFHIAAGARRSSRTAEEQAIERRIAGRSAPIPTAIGFGKAPIFASYCLQPAERHCVPAVSKTRNIIILQELISLRH
jgi:hypothetical protein